MGCLKLTYHYEGLLERSSIFLEKGLERKGAALKNRVDYYPFGMPMPGRQGTAGINYRHSYNIQEKVDEISGAGNHTTAKFWEYDSRLGRRWEIDPVKYPWQSSYTVNNNNPIVYSDKNGLYGKKGEARRQRRAAKKAGYDVTPIYQSGDSWGFNYITESSWVGVFSRTSWVGVSGEFLVGREVRNSKDYHYDGQVSLFEGAFIASSDAAEISGEAKFLNARAYNSSGKGASGMPVSVSMGANATVAEGEVYVRLLHEEGSDSYENAFYGSGKFNVDAKANGKAGHVNLDVKGGLFTGEENKIGLEESFNAGAYTLKGDVTWGVTVLGLEVDQTVGGSLASAHWGGGFTLYYDQSTGKLVIGEVAHVGLGVGAKTGISVKIPLKDMYNTINSVINK